MSQWGKTDIASNSVLWGPSSHAKAPTRTNANLMFGNTTANGYGTGETIGMYGVDGTEIGITGGPVVDGFITFTGSGYSANAAVTITAVNGGTSAVANATSNATGRISAINISTAGSGYKVPPTIAIAAPSALAFAGNSTSVNITTDYITLGSNGAFFANGDLVRYLVAAGNTAVTGLTNNATYYVIGANTTAFQLSLTATGSAIDLTAVPAGAQAGHTFTGQTATANVTVGGRSSLTHAGWVIRREGTGGRAGRVHYETLVAMGSMTSDASDDTILPDS